MTGEVERLDAAAGAEVERAPDRLAEGQLGQRDRRRAHAQDVVGVDGVGRAVEPGREVAEHPEVAVVVGVRAAVEQGPHLAAAGLDEALRRERVHQVRAAPGRRPRASTGACSRNSRVSVSSGDPPAVRRSAGVVSLRPSAAWARGTEPLDDRVVGELGGDEGMRAGRGRPRRDPRTGPGRTSTPPGRAGRGRGTCLGPLVVRRRLELLGRRVVVAGLAAAGPCAAPPACPGRRRR